MRSHGLLSLLDTYSRFLLSEEKTPCGRRFNNPLDGPIEPCRAEIFDCPISTKDKRKLHPVDSTAFPDVLIGYATSAEGSWIVDLIVVGRGRS